MFKTRDEYRAAWDAAYTTDPAVPLCVDLELASVCNAKCSFCLYGDRDWRDGMTDSDWDGKPKRRFMPTAIALRIIDECAAIGVPSLKFNFRGESVLHRDYSRIVQYAASKIHDPEGWARFGVLASGEAGKPKFHDLLVNTNGNAPATAIDGLMAATKVMVSLDSMDPAIYAKVRVGLSLPKAQATIDELVRRGHPDVWVRRVVCRDNASEDFSKAVYARWPKGVKVSEHYAFDRNHYQNEALHDEDTSQWERTYCGYPSQRVVIESSGRMVPCCIAWEGELTGGFYPALSIMEYWNSDWRKRLATDLRAGKFSSPKCQNCTSFMAYNRPERAKVQDIEVKA